MAAVKDFKVLCEICQKELAPSSLRGHKVRVHKVKVTPALVEQKKDMVSPFTIATNEHVNETEEAMVEAAKDAEEDAELHAAASEA